MNSNIVIVGGGFGGLESAFTLKSKVDKSTRITLIDRSPFHSFTPSIHEIVSGKITSRNILIPFTTILSPAGISFINDDVHKIDLTRRHVITTAGALVYDYLILATGARNNFFNVPGAEKHSYHFRSPGSAELIHAELEYLLSSRQGRVHIVLTGGGPEGVEVAGEILDFIHDNGHDDELVADKITMTIIERRHSLLPGYCEKAGMFAGQYLQKRGVKLMSGHCITTVGKATLSLDSGADLPYSLLIWTGGIRPSQLIDCIQLPKERAGWLIVTDRLNSPGDDHVFAIGDAVSIHGDDGPLELQRLAYHASDQAAVASLNIVNHKRSRNLISFAPHKKPQLISIGRDMGIYTKNDQFRTGAWVVSLKKAIERKYLMACLSRPFLIRLPLVIPASRFFQRMKLSLNI